MWGGGITPYRPSYPHARDLRYPLTWLGLEPCRSHTRSAQLCVKFISGNGSEKSSSRTGQRLYSATASVTSGVKGEGFSYFKCMSLWKKCAQCIISHLATSESRACPTVRPETLLCRANDQIVVVKRGCAVAVVPVLRYLDL